MKILLLMIVTSFCFLSCARKAGDGTNSIENEIAGNAETDLPLPDIYSDGKASLIKTGTYRFQVTDVKKTTEAIEAAVSRFPGYISASDSRLLHPLLETKLTIRIHHDYFNELLKEIDKQAVFVNFRNVSTEDVSKEFVDLESRLRTKREVETRYTEILRKKAGTIKELMEAEQQIGALHEEIEAVAGTLKFLHDQVNYSTISLEFYQNVSEETAMDEKTTGSRFSRAVKAGLTGALNLLIAITYIWPLMISGLVAWLIYYFLKGRKIKSLAP